jgi:glycogen operon protein
MSGQPSNPSWASLEGLPNPLGATWIAEEEAWNFAVYAEHAERVTLLLYTEEDPATPVLTQRLDHLRNKSGPVWHCRIPTAALKGARFYAYQVEGPRSPRHPFDAEKILFDPYAAPSTSRPSSIARRRSGRARTWALRPSA